VFGFIPGEGACVFILIHWWLTSEILLGTSSAAVFANPCQRGSLEAEVCDHVSPQYHQTYCKRADEGWIDGCRFRKNNPSAGVLYLNVPAIYRKCILREMRI